MNIVEFPNEVDVVDASYILREEVSTPQEGSTVGTFIKDSLKVYADVNMDGKITMRDAQYVFYFGVNKLPAENQDDVLMKERVQ